MKQPERTELGATGVGEASEVIVEERERQIASSDGREEARRQIINPIADCAEIVDTIAADDRPDAGVAPGSSGSRTER